MASQPCPCFFQQWKRALPSLVRTTSAAGSSLAQVVKTTVYLADMRDFPAVNEVYAEALGEIDGQPFYAGMRGVSIGSRPLAHLAHQLPCGLEGPAATNHRVLSLLASVLGVEDPQLALGVALALLGIGGPSPPARLRAATPRCALRLPWTLSYSSGFPARLA